MSRPCIKTLLRPGLKKMQTEVHLSIRYLSQNARQVPRDKPAVRSRGSRGSSGYPLLVIPITCVGLGVWQIQRREWKLNLLKDIEQKMSAEPIPLPDDATSLAEYTRVKVRGKFDHSREVFIGPRTNVNEPNNIGGQRTSSMGVNVVTPFKLSDRDLTILVNRGHVPFKDRPPQMRLQGQIEDEVEINGIIRHNDNKGMFAHDPMKEGYWMVRKVDEMADVTGTDPIFVDADRSSTVPGGPQGGQTRLTIRNEHMSYIITWFSLAVLTSIIWYRTYLGRVAHPSVIEMMKKGKKF